MKGLIPRTPEGDIDLMAIGILWTLVGFVGMIFGLHIGWWDVLAGLGFSVGPPQNGCAYCDFSK